MRKYISILILALTVYSCTDDGWKSVANTAPTVPVQVYPSDNLLCLESTITFQWEASTDLETKDLEYEVQVATDPGFTQIVQNVGEIPTTQVALTLEKNKAYYWKVRAVDGERTTSDFSETFQFYTEGVGVTNHLPFAPLLIAPLMDADVDAASAMLEWNAKDVDGDALTFDVYFGTENPPTTMVGEQQSETSVEVDLTSGTTYFWKVAVTDAHGEKTIGAVWSFKSN